MRVVPTTLYRLAVWPLVPDVTVTDLISLVNASGAAAALTNVSSTALPSDAGNAYSPFAVWAAGDTLVTNGVPVVGGSGTTASGSGFLRADTTFEPQVRH